MVTTVMLENRAGRLLTLNLEHEAVCGSEHCECAQASVVSVDHDPRTGRRSESVRPKRVCRSVTILPGTAYGPADVAVLGCAEVKALLGRGDLAASVAESAS
jgi:hypothetical protein